MTNSENTAPRGSDGIDPERPQPIRVYICDPEHPHYGESGVLTGKIIEFKHGIGGSMAEVKLDDCKHGTDGCFVAKGQVRAEARRRA